MSNTTDAANGRTCISCANDLRTAAVRCHHCGTLQNWRRHLPTLAVFFSIILGAGSVFSMLLPVVQDQLQKEFAPSATRIGVNATHYTVLIENKGKTPVAVKYINIFFGEDLEFLEIEGGDGVVPENSSRILKLILPYHFERPTEIDYSRNDGGGTIFDRCELLISIIGSGHEQWFELKEENGCWDLNDFLTGQQTVG